MMIFYSAFVRQSVYKMFVGNHGFVENCFDSHHLRQAPVVVVIRKLISWTKGHMKRLPGEQNTCTTVKHQFNVNIKCTLIF